LQQAAYSSGRLRFGVFEVDLRSGELTKHGKRLRLQEQPFQLLAILLEKPGELVTREELHSKLWPRTTVNFDHGVNKAIGKVRDALGDSAANPRFIETVARRGYRFLADVAVVPDGQPGLVEGGVGSDRPTKAVDSNIALREDAGVRRGIDTSPMARRRFHAFARALFGAGIALLLAAAALWIVPSWRHTMEPIRSLAVLPLENMSNDPSQDYFAEGMTEELITQLGQIRSLRVISRTSVMTYIGSHKPLAEIARELHVDAVVEGSVLRSGNQVRVTAQLIAVPADRHIWAQSYTGDLGDTLGLQSRVASAIAGQIRTTLEPREQAALAKSKVVNPDAYVAYLKGRYFWNKRSRDGLGKAIAYFTRAVEIDPNYAKAYSGLADSYALSGDWKYGVLPGQEAFAQAKAAAAKALALDDSLGEAHASLALALDLYGWEWKAAEAEYKRALELEPGYAPAHQWYSWHLIMMGQTSEGIAELKTAASLDPLSLIISADLADALCVARRYDEAVLQSQKTLEMDANFAVGHFELGQAFVQKKLYDQAIAEFKRAIELSGHSGAFDSNLAYVYGVLGQPEEAMEILRTLEVRHDQDPSAAAYITLIYVGLGDRDHAIMWLNTAYEAGFKASILRHPVFDPLRSDARFKDLLGRIGLPGTE
jgi:TolB-like protein/DNA-binding winged helix-turn-helix (wHTH) protein